MNASEIRGQENARVLTGQWTESLTQVLESMTDQKPEVRWQSVTGTFSEAMAASGAGPADVPADPANVAAGAADVPAGPVDVPVDPADAPVDASSGGSAEVPTDAPPGSEQEVLWWEQPFQSAPDVKVWVAAPRTTWEHAGALTLKAAGLETVESGEARNTWLEILSQSLSALARSIGSMTGSEFTCEAGVEQAPHPGIRQWASVSLTFGADSLAPLLFTMSPQLIAMISMPPPESEAANPADTPAPEPEVVRPNQAALRPRTMDLLLDVELPVSISFGKTQLPMKDVLKLTTGSIVELNRGVNDPVEVLINHCLIARGEIVVIEGNYGVRIQKIASQEDRLRSLR